MNIKKTNGFGVMLIEKGISVPRSSFEKIANAPNHDTSDTFLFNRALLTRNPKAKVIRVSRNIMDSCRLVDMESIRNNLSSTNLEIASMLILLDTDESGLIRVERSGSDFSFVFLSNLGPYTTPGILYNAYSFVTKNFYFENTELECAADYEKSVFAVQLLAYLAYGDITEKHSRPKSETPFGGTRFVNNSSLGITFCDSLWRQRVSTDGFKVRGHFRLQPVGKESKGRKLIWIEEFEKTGYNRKATVEILNSKNLKA